MKKLFFCILLYTSTALTAKEHSEPVYASTHDMLVKTIQNGHIEGIMIGDIAEHLTREFRSTGTLLVEAKVVKSLPQEDCKRIEVTYTKKDVTTPKGLTGVILKMKLNYCLDGSPPDVEAQ